MLVLYLSLALVFNVYMVAMEARTTSHMSKLKVDVTYNQR